MKLIAITGGIGAGKSVVSRCVMAMGFDVYDCDSRAKALMDNSMDIIMAIGREIGAECVDLEVGKINREVLAGIVFNDGEALSRLNGIVHGAVLKDISTWAESQAKRGVQKAFVETAILYQSNLDGIVDEVWEITAPRDSRIERVMARNGISSGLVESRIAAQEAYIPNRVHRKIYRITNDGREPVLPVVERLAWND
ncbi:MAG: dephospho-CoA kinase [Muribaculaceae bacterium]|nr:dephospho-CoA kinase [Muribaculaceae bacterium]